MLTVGISLKAYFGYRQTLTWCEAIRDLAVAHPSVGTAVRLVVFPSLPALAPCASILGDTPVEIGAQTVSANGYGADTGEVPAAMLAELGCRYAEIGHAERRARYGETPEVIRRKVLAASEAGLAPWLCVGESTRSEAEAARRDTAAQVRDSEVLTACPDGAVIAYEPVWAIGRDVPADPDYVRDVCDGLRDDVGAAGLHHLRGQRRPWDVDEPLPGRHRVVPRALRARPGPRGGRARRSRRADEAADRRGDGTGEAMSERNASPDPAARAAAIVKATTFFDDPDVLAKVSRGLGEAMVGINVEDIAQPHRLAERGW